MSESIRHKIGIFGGTFDPVHIGHLFIARAALEQLGLEKIVFVPSGRPPHKQARRGASDEQRVEMLKRAVAPEPLFEIDLIEMEPDEYSYSYITMGKLTRMHPENDYYFLIGEDSLKDLSSWRCPEELVRLCHIAVTRRIGYSDLTTEELNEKQKGILGGDFLLVDCPYIDISSSGIRKRAAEGKSVRYYSTDSVVDYIAENRLYSE